MHTIYIYTAQYTAASPHPLLPPGPGRVYTASESDFINAEQAVVLHLDYDETRAWPAFAHTPLLVLAQSITVSLQELPIYAVRMNVWPGFAANKQVEMVAAEPHKDLSTQILASFQLMPLFIPDVVGMISPRAVAGILQEANLAVQDDLASTTDIDLAMKLGTNYPKGPFEWMQLLGPEKCQCLWQCLQDDAAN